MQVKGWVTLAYAVLVLAGGITGYLKASSRASLISGGIFGLALALGAAGMLRGNHAATSATLSLVALLALFFAYRLATGGKFMPAGLMLLVSAIELAVLIWGPAE